jgi:hypothetical protein
LGAMITGNFVLNCANASTPVEIKDSMKIIFFMTTLNR